MKILSKIVLFFVIFITLFSCKKKDKSINNFNSKFKTSYINFDADSIYYKLNVGSQNDNYYRDQNDNLLFLVTKEVYVSDRCFGGYNKQQSLSNAEVYSKKTKKSTYLVTKISIKNKNSTFNNVWQYRSEINFHEDSYGLYELDIFLEDSYAEYNGRLQDRLHINFKTVDYDNGYKLYTLNYIYKDKQWQLVSRERVCTITNDINHEEIGYCIDTINYNCQIKGYKFILTDDYLFRLGNSKCY